MVTDKSDIKIFVSRRIDLDSVAINNPLFVPVRCGAVYDENNSSPYIGDDTGDNISLKRITFSELTVQYWAWKNVKADWYGLCHYRRYFSFADKMDTVGAHGLVIAPLLDEKNMKRFNLLNESKMRKEIEQCDLVMPCGLLVTNITLLQGRAQTVSDLWNAHAGNFYERHIIDRMFELIDELAPEYSYSSREYFSNNMHYGYNCYIMKKDLFERLCNLQFSVLEALAKEMESSNYLDKYPRAIGYVGEMLFGIFLYHIKRCGLYRIKEKQLVYFEETRLLNKQNDIILCYAKHIINVLVWSLSLHFFPLGTKRREIMKAIYIKMINKI